jgi:type IV pilus assembly protein PilE
MSSPRTASRPPDSGFTLIEVMIVVVIVAVLAAIALPSYTDYLRRGRIIEATAKLADHRVRMEQYFLDSRTYSAGGTTCGVPDPSYTSGRDSFEVRCTAASATAYTVTATGRDSMAGFVYTIDQANVRATSAAPIGWSTSATCWTVRKGTTAYCS